MNNPLDDKNNPEKALSKTTLKLGVGGVLVILIIWGIAIYETEPGGLMKPMGELLITVLVFLVSGIGCITIALKQFFTSQKQAFISLFYGLLPILVFAVVLLFLKFVVNIEFG